MCARVGERQLKVVPKVKVIFQVRLDKVVGILDEAVPDPAKVVKFMVKPPETTLREAMGTVLEAMVQESASSAPMSDPATPLEGKKGVS